MTAMEDLSQQLIQDRIRELRENTDFVSTLLESLTGYAIIAADFDGNIIAYNEGAHQIYGYTPEEIIGKQNLEIFFPQEFIAAGSLQQATTELIDKGRFSYEGEQIRKNGEIFPAQILFTLTKNKSGKVVGFIEIVADLTERKRAERMEAEAQALAERAEQLERELHSLEWLSLSSKTAITAQTFGLMPLHQAAPDRFNRLVRRYGDLLELALKQQVYRVEYDISGKLRAIAEELSSFKAGPRDVVEIHSSALRRKVSEASHTKAQAYVEAGRVMVLELMGHLVSCYRTNSLGAATVKINNKPVRGKITTRGGKR